MAECIFCKIARKEIPKEFLYEDGDVIAFADINPLAPVHVLVIPRRHISSVNDFMAEDAVLIGKLILAARAIARGRPLVEEDKKCRTSTFTSLAARRLRKIFILYEIM